MPDPWYKLVFNTIEPEKKKEKKKVKVEKAEKSREKVIIFVIPKKLIPEL